MNFMKVVSVSLILMILFVNAASAAQGYTKVKTNADLCADRLLELQTKQSVHVEKAEAKGSNTKNLYKHAIVDINEQVTISASLDSSTLVCGKSADGNIRIKDLGKDHKLRDIRIKASDLAGMPGLDKGIVKVTHFNDAGLPDAVWIQQVVNNGGYVYFEAVPFSEVVIGGFVGDYTKTGTLDYQTSTAFSLGTTFDASAVNAIEATVTPTYTETSPYDIPTDGLIGFWKFDENTGTNVSDSSGNGNHGTAIGGMNWTDGKYNSAGSFDGVNDYVYSVDTIKNIFGNTMQNFTVGLNVLEVTPNSTNYEVLFSIIPGGNTLPDGNNEICLYTYNGNVMAKFQYNGIGTEYYNNIGFPEDFTNKQVIFTSNETTACVIVDNNVINTFQTGGRSFDFSTSSNHIVVGGYRSYTLVANCTIDNVMLYDRTLSESEITAIYYDSIEDLKLKTNSNTGYSDEIDESGTVSIPYDSEDEDIASLTATVPENVTIGGVTVRDYSNTVTPFEVVATVGYTEDTTLITETLTDESYQLVIRHTPGNDYTADSTVVYTSDTNAILSSSYLTYDLTSTNPNAVLAFNPTTLKWTITTGAITADTTYTYNIIATTEGTEVLDVVDGVGDSFVETYPNAGNETTAIGTSFTVTSTSEFVGLINGSDIWNSTSALILVMIVLGGVGLMFTYFRKVD